jgi:hypothetical protein
MYPKLPTYKITVADRCSRNLALLSRLPIAICMSQAESLQLLQKDLPKLGKACAGISSFEFFKERNPQL